MKTYKQLVEVDKYGFPEYYKTPKNTSLWKIAKRYYKTGDKLYDVDWVRGDFHIMAMTKHLERIKEHNWSRKHSRRGDERYEELYQDIKKNGITEAVQVYLYRHEKRAKLGEGNHRLAIAKELGITHIPVVFFFYMGTKKDEKEEKELDQLMAKHQAEQDNEAVNQLLKDLLGN